MKGIDLDAMRGRWKTANRALDEHLQLDVEAMRRALAGRTRAAFRRHSFWLSVGLVTEAVVVAALLAFMIDEWNQWRYLLMAAPIALLALAELVVGLRQWLALRRLDLSAPLLRVRAELDVLRARRLRMTKWIMLSSVLLWWPAVIVLLRGLTGFDFLRILHPSVVIITVVVGLAFIPLALGVGHWLSRRFSGSPGYQRFLQDAAGRSWSKAEDQVLASMRFEDALATGKVEQLLHSPAPPPAAAVPALTRLQRRTLAAILFYAALLVLTGLFHLTHGGEPLFIVAGIALNLIWIPQMVAAIVHREALGRLDFGADAGQLHGLVSGPVAMRVRLARATLVLAPVLLLPMLAVVVQTGTGVDLLAAAWRALAAIAVAGALAATLMLAWLMRRGAGEFAPALVEVMLFGARSGARELLARLGLGGGSR